MSKKALLNTLDEMDNQSVDTENSKNSDSESEIDNDSEIESIAELEGSDDEPDDEDSVSPEIAIDNFTPDAIVPPTTVKKPRGRPRRAKSSTVVPAAQSEMNGPIGVDTEIYNKIRSRVIDVDDSSSDDDSVADTMNFQKLTDTAYAEKTARLFSVRERPLKEELDALLVIHRDENGLICDPKHTTIPILTMYEKARILSERVQQLEVGAEPLVPVEPGMHYNNYAIANKELEHKKLPFIVQRPLPDNTCEYWRLSDLQLIS